MCGISTLASGSRPNAVSAVVIRASLSTNWCGAPTGTIGGMPDVVVSEFMVDESLAPLRARHTVVSDPDLHADRMGLFALVGDARALIVRNQTAVDAELLAAAPFLEVVGRLGVGLDNIDLAACEERGIAVCPAVGANAVAVAEYVIGALFVLVRGVFGAAHRVAAGEWPRLSLEGSELSGRTLGLVGYGGIAREVADRARVLGMRTVAHDPFLAADDPVWETATSADLATLFSTADAVSLHVPLSDETRGLVGTAMLDLMKPHAVLVNTSRGGVVDEDALVAALRSGSIGGAALDVFATEPVTPDSGSRFADVPNLILTPHIAGLTTESGRRVSDMTVANVLEVLSEGVPS